MKKFKRIIFLLLFLTGCSSADKQQYVKNVLLYKENEEYVIGLRYYDFSRPEEAYSQATYSDEDIYRLSIKAMADKQYNFRLCETICISHDIFTREINKAVYLINSLRISPCADLLFYYGENSFYPGDSSIDSPLYDISLNNNSVTANIPLIDENGNQSGIVLIKDGVVTGLLDYQQQLVRRMVMNTVKKCGFSFREDSLWADLDNIHTSFYIKDNELNIVINLTVNERKGMSNSIETSRLSDSLMTAEIVNNVYDLYEDIAVRYNYNLHWYCTQTGVECEGIKVKVNIV